MYRIIIYSILYYDLRQRSSSRRPWKSQSQSLSLSLSLSLYLSTSTSTSTLISLSLSLFLSRGRERQPSSRVCSRGALFSSQRQLLRDARQCHCSICLTTTRPFMNRASVILFAISLADPSEMSDGLRVVVTLLLKLTWDSALNVGCPPAYPPERTAGAPSPRSDSKRWSKYRPLSSHSSFPWQDRGRDTPWGVSADHALMAHTSSPQKASWILPI